MKFSVVIPVYNGEAVIEKAINSVITQSFTDFELIVVNDGSTDNTEQVINSYCQSIDRLNWQQISSYNRGRSHARNLGIKAAKGEFICFLDADDAFNKEHLAEFNKATELYRNVDCFFADSKIETLDKSWTRYSNFLQRLLNRGNFWVKENDYVIFDERLTEHLVEGSLIPMCSTAISRDVLIEENMFNETFSSSEDFDLWFRLTLRHRFVAINKPLSTVYHHDGNTSHPKQKYNNLTKQLDVTQSLLKNVDNLPSKVRVLLEEKEHVLFSELLYHASLRSFGSLWISLSANRHLIREHKVNSLKSIIRAIIKRK